MSHDPSNPFADAFGPPQGQQPNVQYVQQGQPQQVVYVQNPQQPMQYGQPQQNVQYVQPNVQYVQQPNVQYAQQPQQMQYVQQQPNVQYVQQGQPQQYVQQPQQMQYVQQPNQQQNVAMYQQQVYGNQQMMQPQQVIKKKPPPQYGANQGNNNVRDDEKGNIYQQANQIKNLNINAKKWDQPRNDNKGTVEAHPKFNAAQALEDAKELRKAMKGLGCDKSKVAAITGQRSHAQRLMIKKAFVTVDQELYGKGKNRDLLKDLKSELSGDYENLVMGLYMEPGEFDARLIKKAVDGAGFNTDLLVEVLCTRTNEEIELMKLAWSKCLKEKKSMVERCEGETKKMLGSNNFQTLILTLLKAKRPGNKKPDESEVKQDAEDLNRSIMQDKTKQAKAKFIDVYTSRSWAHIGAISDVFQRLSKKYTLQNAIKKTFGDGSDTSKALRVITDFCSEPYDFWAQKLRVSMKGLGTDDSLLVRIVVGRCEIDMDNIRNVFAKRYGEGKTLKKWIEGDCSGAYRDLLNALCGYGI